MASLYPKDWDMQSLERQGCRRQHSLMPLGFVLVLWVAGILFCAISPDGFLSGLLIRDEAYCANFAKNHRVLVCTSLRKLSFNSNNHTCTLALTT